MQTEDRGRHGYPDKMRKFDKESPITFWIEFFKNPYSEICRELYKFVPELKEAKELFEKAKADPKKRRLLVTTPAIYLLLVKKKELKLWLKKENRL